MKHFISKLIITISLVAITNISFAYQNEPIGFRNMLWEDNLQKLVNQYGGYVEYDKILSNEIINDKTYIGYTKNPYISGIKIDQEIYYSFFNDKLYSIQFGATFNNKLEFENIFKKFLSKMKILYGEPDMQPSFNQSEHTLFYNWFGKYNGVDIDLCVISFSERSIYTFTVTMNYLPICREIDTAFKNIKEQEAKQGW